MIWVWLSDLGSTVIGWITSVAPQGGSFDMSSIDVVVPIPLVSGSMLSLTNSFLAASVIVILGSSIVRALRGAYALIPGCG